MDKKSYNLRTCKPSQHHKDMLEEIGWDIPESTESFSIEDYIAMVEPATAAGYDVILAGFVEAWCYFDPYFNFIHQQQEGETPDMVQQAMDGEITWQQDIFANAFDVFVDLNDAGVWRQDALSMDYQVQAFGDWLERKGIFETYTDGVIFLDEFGELSNENQKKLLRIIEQKCFSKIGSDKIIRSNAKIIAATNKRESEFR
ncbi:MAG: sigma 54-interacting transcriptional regulator, partial [Rhodospirillales bacterium]|nr:sigma 54-interacting transcriptional regulator [Rhodospirillales bacterium]